MAGAASTEIDSATAWGGGHESPFKVSYGKMMMWFFLVSDGLTFGGLLCALGYTKFTNVTGDWPMGEEVFTHIPFSHMPAPLIYVAFMTFVLIVSSVTMVLAVEAGHRMDKKGVIKWLLWTVVGGLIFLGSQVWEWSTFIAGYDGILSTWHDNATLLHSPYGGEYELVNHHGHEIKEMVTYGPTLYANFFFFITGFHGFHVFTGVLFNALVLRNVIRGVYHKRGHYEMVEKVGLYWHFVDLVWVFVFTFFYLV
ncbi:cytochrome c oxidase subunit 3 [Paracrocinitomix mangrovi]|uniref:cytochrome c oxidase subunit 3 n=1 Tax=Paracrocinitomix mangrovi TaxID=2862509 RepID=UPI001C8E2247|nr:cytochrome c oxidase subunit 3 [Paracrocinitomix mangrovi]UKN03425.1 cytochrome c oxidase subunit 3 [Paracrocinitomix mangrovi]